MTIRFGLLACLIGFTGCATTASPTATTVAPSTSTSTSVGTTITTRAGLEPCPEPNVTVSFPPSTVSESQTVATDYSDVFTSLPGTSQTVFANEAGAPAMVIVRGALPPTNWVGATERVELRGVTGAIGPLADGMWAVAWAESSDRCDEYSIFIYPPGTIEEARRVAESAG
jgi:hypothetical protein